MTRLGTHSRKNRNIHGNAVMLSIFFYIFVCHSVDSIVNGMMNTSSSAAAAQAKAEALTSESAITNQIGKKESKENNKAPNILLSHSVIKKCHEEQTKRLTDAQKKSWKTKQERKSFLDVKAKYDKMKRRKYYRQNFFRIFSCVFVVPLSHSWCRFYSWLFLYLFRIFFRLCCRIFVRFFFCCVFGFVCISLCAFSYPFLVFSSQCNVLLTFSDFFPHFLFHFRLWCFCFVRAAHLGKLTHTLTIHTNTVKN